MYRFTANTRKLLCSACTLLMFISSVPLQSFAQQNTPDFEAPIIEHDDSDFSLADSPQVFGAQVADNIGLKSVKLFYRFNGVDEYTTVDMNPIADSAFYSARISTDSDIIEYYIQAEDDAGNVVLKGFAFAPLVRDLTPPALPAPIVQAEQPPMTVEKPRSKILYYVLGAVAIGAIAGLAGGGSGGSGDPAPSGCGTGSCAVTFTLNTP